MKSTTYKDGLPVQETYSNEQQSSIEISRNAKGDHAFKVKIYSDDPKEIESKLEEYLSIAKKAAGVE